jgi:uncharacterized CHY-type Zn-finger protein|nr:MAG TPA: hypothetical protein [Caudoviricetes sp.]
MTCKDCYHYDVCHRRINSIDFLPFIKGKVSISSIMYKKCDDVEKHCLHFKDKSRYIELPCKVGDKVYKIVRSICFGNHIQEMTIKDFEIYANTDYEALILRQNDVFLDKSKAEEKLKELNNEQE